MAKKWEITGLDNHKTLCESAKIILAQRIEYLLEIIRKFFEDETVENLHNVRIALRRVRYNMELFPTCFDKEKFLSLYNKIESLQDSSGFVRDLDVLTENMNKMKSEKVRISKKVFERVSKTKENLKESLKLELMKFIHSKALSNFQKYLFKQGEKNET
jgi:CHAD domain-containing protein